LKLPHYYITITNMDSRFIEVDGAKLRKLRRERALSQQDVERGTGISQATLSDLEQGKRGARVSTLRKLAESLGVEPRELMKEEQG
jgi:transcriptional regulator with XRE-family HTH domain